MKAISSCQSCEEKNKLFFFKTMTIPNTSYYKNRLCCEFSPLYVVNILAADVSDYLMENHKCQEILVAGK